MIQKLPITIEVEANVAQVYQAASVEQRRKLDALLNLKLREALRSDRSLEEIMQAMSQQARERGLTEAELEQMLRDA